MITRTRDVLHGQPRIAGTRIPTRMVVGMGFDVDAIAESYPTLTETQIDAAIRYERRVHRRLARWLTTQTRTPRLWAAMALAGDDWGI